MKKHQIHKLKLNPYLLVTLSFIVVIFVGAFLINMPFAQRSGTWGDYTESLFTSVSATCVTGASTYKEGVANSLTFGGQLVTLILIQIGGLGFITFLTFIFNLFAKKIRLKDRFYIAQMVGSDDYADVFTFIKRLIGIEFSLELIGFILGLPVFLTMYKGNIGQGLWNSLYHSVSAVNNAGFDLFNGNSLIGGLQGISGEYIGGSLYYYFCTYSMVLIIMGGISFVVLIEVLFSKKRLKQYKAFTKIVLTMTISLIILGTLGLYLTDGTKADNPMTLFDCLFHSVSARTAGFSTYTHDNISTTGKIISCFLMFVGGAPLGTAGGVKVTTLFILILALICFMRGKKFQAFHRFFSKKMFIKAALLIFISITIIIVGFVCLTSFGLTEEYSSLGLKSDQSVNFLYEIFSCFGTVGFSVGIEPYLTVGSRITLCVLMFLGRIGPITILHLLDARVETQKEQHYKLVKEDFLIG